MAPATKVNGVNIDQLFSTIDLLKEKPELAKFKFRATNKWLGGTHQPCYSKGFLWSRQGRYLPVPPFHMTWMNRKSS